VQPLRPYRRAATTRVRSGGFSFLGHADGRSTNGRFTSTASSRGEGGRAVRWLQLSATPAAGSANARSTADYASIVIPLDGTGGKLATNEGQTCQSTS